MEIIDLTLQHMAMGKKIKARRGLLGHTQEYMANELNISTAAYQNYEYDRSGLINPNFYAICKILGMHPMELIELDFNAGLYTPGTDNELTLCRERIQTLESKIEGLIAENAVLRYKLGHDN